MKKSNSKSISQSVQTVFCFFDETGLLNSPRDKFFGVGMIKISKPEELYLEMKYLRDRLKFYDELKWHDIYRKNTPIMNQFIDLFFNYGKARFSCYIFKKTDLDLKKHFNSDLYRAYQSFACMQVCSNLSKNESAVLLMDDLNTPRNLKFEQNIKKKINNKFNRNAAYGVCRAYSKGVELIQLTDLFLGAVCYDFKLAEKLISGPGIHKKVVLDHMRKKSNIKSFVCDVRTKNVDIWIFKTK
jgi:hypothetical protein